MIIQKNYTQIYLEGEYLGNSILSLPAGIVNKGVVGCGATTLALTNNEPYVIAVPTKALIRNKISENTNVLAVHSEIESLPEKPPKKIMVTYDSLSRVSNWIQDETHNYRLLVDEWHLLIESAAYRSKAIYTVLENYKRYKDTTFISATPINYSYLPYELKDLPITEYKWINCFNVKPSLMPVNFPLNSTAKLIKKVLDNSLVFNNHLVEEVFIFLNSVEDILNIISKLQGLLDSNNTKIIVSDCLINASKLNSLGFDISYPYGPNAKINFLTSTAFQGIDLYSEKGLSIIVTTGSKYTRLAINTTVFQIAGRIRTKSNPFNNTFIHIFRDENKNIDDYIEQLRSEINDTAKYSIEELNNLNSKTDKNAQLKLYNALLFGGYYIIQSPCEYIFDEVRYNQELYWLDNVYNVYTNGINLNSAYRYKFNQIDIIDETEFLDTVLPNYVKRRKKVGFSNLLKNYLVDSNDQFEKEFPFILEFKKHCESKGLDFKLECERFKYNKKAIEEQLHKEIVIEKLKTVFTNSCKYTAREVKEKLNRFGKYTAKDILKIFPNSIETRNKSSYQYIIHF